MAVVLILSFVEERSDEVENAALYVSRKQCLEQPSSANLRANYGSDERSPRQFAISLARDNLTGWTKTSSVLLATWSTGATVGSSKNGDSDERANKAEVQEHQRPADKFRLVLQEAAEKHGNECVENCSSENTDNGAIGSCEAASSLSGILLDDFDEPGGEETDGNDRGDELDESQDTLEP